MAEGDAVADFDPLAGPHEGQPAIRRLAHVQGGGDLGEALTVHRARAPAQPFELRRDHLGVVEDQDVARCQQRRQVADGLIGQRTGRIDAEQARALPRRDRPERDPLRRQLEIEQINAHVGSCRRA